MRKFLFACIVLTIGVCRPAPAQERSAGLRTVTQMPSKEKRWALIIGVDDYGNGIQKLYGAVNDAKALKDALVKYANFPEEQVIVLTTGGDGEQPTRTNILLRLFRLKERVPKDGLLLFAFSGHGVERDRKVFLLPSDALQTRDVEELKQVAIPADTITEQIERAEIKQVLILLDACRNDPEAGKGDKDNVLTEGFRSSFSFDAHNKGIEAFATLYATSFGKRAYEFRDRETGLQRGFFTWALVKGLEGGAANADGEVTLRGLVDYLAEAVPRKLKTENAQGEQVPYSIIGDGYKADKLVIALVPRSATVGVSESPASQPYIKRAWALHDEGNLDEAIKEYEKALSLDPGDVGTYVDLGNAYSDKGDYDQVIRILTKVIEMSPDYSVAYNNRGNAYSDKGMLDAAIKDYDKAIKLEPRYDDAFVNRGNAYHREGDDGRALQDYDEALRLNPRNSNAYYNRGVAYDEGGNYDEALKAYSQAIALDPNNMDAHYHRGQVQGAKGDYDKAITDLTFFLTFQPDNVDGLSYRAMLYFMKGNRKDALTDLDRAVELAPGEAELHEKRGMIYSIAGEHVKAFEDFNRALKLDPKEVGAYNNRGSLYAKLGRYDRALADYQQAVALDPEDIQVYINLGFLYVAQGDLEQADRYFKRGKELVDKSLLGSKLKSGDALKQRLNPYMGPGFKHFFAAVSFLVKKNFDQAVAEFTRAISEDPQFTLLYTLRSATYLMKGDNDLALADVNLVIALSPEDVVAHLLKANIYEEKGDYRQAIISYTEAIRLNPEHVQAYRDRAGAYEKMGEGAKAQADRRKADEIERRSLKP